MAYLLDTDTCVDYLRGESGVRATLQATSPTEVCTSSVVVAELEYGAERSARPEKNHSLVEAFLAEVECVSFDRRAATEYGRIRWELESSGSSIGANDLLIAAHARQLGHILVTSNTREFRRVEGLAVESWRGR